MQNMFKDFHAKAVDTALESFDRGMIVGAVAGVMVGSYVTAILILTFRYFGG